ncbi:MAG TPA: ATP-binding cassette domain-containing protein, partial [Sphingomonas sp.]|nr:ATP-binding cassette domain-containing protein [Sphingomonas sp.]
MSDNQIVVDGISKGFGSLSVVRDVHFDVADGEFVAIVGPSGCGKSTLLNIIAGFERADRGAVRIDGAKVAGPSRNGIMISQHGSVFPWLTVQDNVMFGLTGAGQAERMELAHRYIEMVGLSGFEKAYPH